MRMRHQFPLIPFSLGPSMSVSVILLPLALLQLRVMVLCQTYLRANGQPDTYGLINSVFGGNAVEVPDCGHGVLEFDSTLGRHVFKFHVHVNEDNDRCSGFDRQRTEIKPPLSSPGYLKGFEGDTVTLSWNFRLDSNFTPVPSFTHIHQLKATDGDATALGLISLTPRRNKLYENDKVLELIHVDSHGTTTKLTNVDMTSVAGRWVHVREQITYKTNGTFSINMTDLETEAQIMACTNNSIDMWRPGASHVRPKWGIYRSLKHKEQLRDEQLEFDAFCLAKGKDDCV